MQHDEDVIKSFWQRRAFEACLSTVEPSSDTVLNADLASRVEDQDGTFHPISFARLSDSKLAPGELIALLMLCRELAQQEETEIYGRNAATVVRTNLRYENLKWALRALAPADFEVKNLDRYSRKGGLHMYPFRTVDGISRRLDVEQIEEMADGSDPLLFVAGLDDALPDVVRHFAFRELRLHMVDRHILACLTALKFPSLDRSAIDTLRGQ